MEHRIDALERDVCAIKLDIVEIKSTYWSRQDGRALSNRVSNVEIALAKLTERVEGLAADIIEIKAELGQLRNEIADLTNEIADLRNEIAKFRNDMTNLRAEFYMVAANLKAWMIGIAISTITVTSGVQFALSRMLIP